MDRSRLLALIVLCAGALMAIVDETIVAVSLPAIQRDLGFTPSGLAWVTSAYLIAFGGLLLLFGRLGDIVGRKRVFLGGLAVFTAASALCGFAWSAPVLLAARFVQGVGAAALTAVVLGMIATLFPEPGERAKAIGAFSFVQASGGTIGSLSGGLITQAASWHWIFAVNVPIGVAALGFAVRLLPREPGTRTARADVPGAVLVTAALMTLVYTITNVERYGWASTHTAGFGVVALVLLAGFVVRQAKAENPLLPLRLFRSRMLSGANVVLFLLVASMFGFMFTTVLYLRQVAGLSAQSTGIAMIPPAATIAAVSLGLSAKLNTRFGERRVLLVGLALLVLGLGLLGRVPVDAVYAVDVLPGLVVLGVGFGMAMPALMAQGMSDATPEDAGLASGLFNTTQQVGGALGLAVLAVLSATRTELLRASGAEPAVALLGGYHAAYLTGMGVVAMALGVAAATLRLPRSPSLPKPTRSAT
ncbi:DHA2 family efflux MFS transporter permease subunit [Saccharopolyspora sp. K220]|uniref:DHA2 family efflux MFS transporter permease subunit n=1 Tax=Saccharopolyspora soli TaxID=2926618 RepID=UPI001F58D58A|nr:DHA2 family efflux MFS transporter permease subunit [Saccharopolyspora soli]MCI2420865.1 DHA2 family efflux MFS transporter permease subunit [Saccharopolyspora soli]